MALEELKQNIKVHNQGNCSCITEPECEIVVSSLISDYVGGLIGRDEIEIPIPYEMVLRKGDRDPLPNGRNQLRKEQRKKAGI